MPSMTAVRQTTVTRNQPGSPPSVTMDTIYQAGKVWAYTSAGATKAECALVNTSGGSELWRLVTFASPVTIGTRAVTQAWCKAMDWGLPLTVPTV